MQRTLFTLAAVSLAVVATSRGADAPQLQPAVSDVFVAGQDGVHTYRIPALVLAPSGAVLVFCEARKEGLRDASPTDMVLKRSLDGGRTWLPKQTLLRGQGSDAIMNPVALVDRVARRVFLLCCNTNRATRGEHRRHLLLSSGDDGQTWSAPTDLGPQTADYDDSFVPGPGCGIQMRSGRLVVPGYTGLKIDTKTEEGFRARVIYSDDGGTSWRMGKPVDNHTNESQVVELADGRLLLNMRQGTGQSCRAVARSSDGGASWGPVCWDRALPECPCQASLLRHSSADQDGRSILLFANPDNVGERYGVVERTKMTVRLSYDEGQTWPVKKLLHTGPSSYSGLVRFPDGDVGVVFEGGQKHRREWIRFMRLPLAWLTGAEQPDKSADGLVAHWTFDEARGDVARDVTGHGHDAALKDVEWVASPRGHALRFASKQSLARYGQVDSMNLSGNVTLAVWLRTDATFEPDKTHLIFGDTGLGVERNLNLRLDGRGGLRFEWADGQQCDWLAASAAQMNGAWKHVAVVADAQAGRVAIYVDGALAAHKAMNMPISRSPIKERLTGWFYNGFFQGELDDVRLYHRALSAAEVQRLFQAQADVEVAVPRVLFDAGSAVLQGRVATAVRNWSQQPRRLAVTSAAGKQEVTVAAGETAELVLGAVAFEPVWRSRNDLLLCQSQPNGVAALTIHRDNAVEQLTVRLPSQSVVEPLRVQVEDPWQRALPPGKTTRVKLDVQLAVPIEQLRQGALRLRLIARDSGREVLSRTLDAPQSRQTLTLDVAALPWGAYDLEASLCNGAQRTVVTTRRTVTVLPGGPQQIRTRNNLVSELLDARGLLRQRRIEFMNPRHGWVWFSAAGKCALTLGGDRLLTAEAGRPAVEAMRLLPPGRHVLELDGQAIELLVRAIPGLVYNVYPCAPQIAPFGAHTWQRLARHTLPSTNMIESPLVDVPEQKEWTAAGKKWLANVQAPGLIDDKQWTEEQMLTVWLKPGTATAHAERPGLELAKISGMQVDEYYPGAKSTRFMLPLVRSLARLAESPASAGKLWIPFTAGKFGATPDNLLMRVALGADWPFSEEVYVGEMPSAAEDLRHIRTQFLGVAEAYEAAHPGALRRMIFTPMYAYLPYCTTNRCPQADFRVHLDLQMQLLATEPAFFGLWGVQPYRSNYVDEELLNCMGRMLRHYCIEGQTARMLSDPYELRHVADPDFEQGTARWHVAAAEEGAIAAGKFAGYGVLEGRYQSGTIGDTFVRLRRSAKRPNVVSQQLSNLVPGRLYSLKLITADEDDLQHGRSRKAPQAVAIAIKGAEILPGGFSYPFRSCRDVQKFTAQSPFWMTYHWLRFRATGTTAKLAISDWVKPDAPGGPVGQRIICNFVEVQPVLAD